jgi:Ser/Thr protein kinase RdoA (MazF antagonist)
VAYMQQLDGGTQVSVWRVALKGDTAGDVAVRFVNRPLDLLKRQAEMVRTATARGASASRILFNQSLPSSDGNPHCLQITEWVGGEHPRATAPEQARAVGVSLARLHRVLRGHEEAFSDRPLRLDSCDGYLDQLRSLGPSAAPILQPMERQRRVLRVWETYLKDRLERQLIHGDLHAANVLVNDQGAAFIDFDKMMVGPRVFDLAKYIATTCFYGQHEVKLARRSVSELLAGYEEVDRLGELERRSIAALCMILNAESALCGLQYGVPHLTESAQDIGRWWTRRGRFEPPVTAMRPAAKPQPAPQLRLFRAHQRVTSAAPTAAAR